MSDIQTSLRRILCELLKDAEVQADIRKIVRKEKDQEREFQREIEELEREKEVLHHQMEEARIECERLHHNCNKLEKEKEELEKQLQLQKKEFESLEEINEVWQGMLKLEKSQKAYLKGLCGSWDIKSFIALGKDKNGIKQLWNFIRDEIMNSNRKMENIRILAKFFDLCIRVYNSSNIRKERFEKIEVSIGKEYDSRQYIKTSESIVNGLVREVVLNGYSIQDDVMKPIVIVR